MREQKVSSVSVWERWIRGVTRSRVSLGDRQGVESEAVGSWTKSNSSKKNGMNGCGLGLGSSQQSWSS